jgi:hypothetical protein
MLILVVILFMILCTRSAHSWITYDTTGEVRRISQAPEIQLLNTSKNQGNDDTLYHG